MTWRNFLLAAGRDLTFGLSIFFVLIVAAITIYQLETWLPSKPRVAIAMAITSGFSLYHTFYYAAGTGLRAKLISGPFHRWVGFGAGLEQWCRFRALALTGMSLALLSIPIGMFQPLHVPLFVALAGIGVVIKIFVTRFLNRLTWPKLSFKIPKVKLTRPTSTPSSLWISATVAMRHKIGPVPAKLLILIVWSLAAAAAGLAARNNSDTNIGFIGVSVIGLCCGIALTWPDLSLLRFLAYQSVKVRSLIVAVVGPSLSLAIAMSLVAGFIAGLPVPLAMMSFGLVLGGVLIWNGILFSYGMTKSEAGAVGFAVRDIFLGLLIKAALLSEVFVLMWLIGKLIFNYMNLNRLRWREPQ